MIQENPDVEIGASFKSLDGIKDLPSLIRELEEAGIAYFHLDFFDGHMVKERGLTADDARDIRKLTHLPIEAHLMMYQPNEMGYYRDFGINRVIIQHESEGDKEQMLLDAKKKGMESGIALKPSSPHDDHMIIYPYISDQILVMATRCGSKGRVYDEHAPERVHQILMLYTGPVEVNSGVKTEPKRPLWESTTYQLSQAGATRFAIERGLFAMGIPIKEAVKLNLYAAMQGNYAREEAYRVSR